MNKTEFTSELVGKLPSLPAQEIDERLSFYLEMIDDRMEEGLSEEEAVAQVGSVDDIATEILSEIPLSMIVKEKIKPTRRIKPWEIVLLILGAPVWLPILISLLAVALSLYISFWSIIISLWAVFASVVATAFAGIFMGVCFICGGFTVSGMFIIGCSVICAGVSILLFYGCKYATKGLLILSKKIALLIKQCFVKKEEME